MTVRTRSALAASGIVGIVVPSSGCKAFVFFLSALMSLLLFGYFRSVLAARMFPWLSSNGIFIRLEKWWGIRRFRQ